MNKKMHVRQGDNVIVLSGKQKGKKGKVLAANPKAGKVIVEGVNMVSKHKKPRKAGDEGGIIHQEAPIYACKVMVVCSKCSEPTRIARKVLSNGDIVRCSKKCDEEI